MDRMHVVDHEGLDYAKTDALTMIREVKALDKKVGGCGKFRQLVYALAE